jgi:hypothetical protein
MMAEELVEAEAALFFSADEISESDIFDTFGTASLDGPLIPI